MLAKLNQLRMI